MSFEGGEQPDAGVALGGADPVLAWLIKRWRVLRSWALPCWVAAGIWYITPRNIIVCQISLEMLLMLGEDQKKLAHFTIHHQAKNNVLVHCNCKHSCKREMQRTHSSDCFLYWHLLTQSVWPLCYQLLLSPACLTLGADPNHTISQCACCPWWGQAGPVQPTCLARANISANNTWKIASAGQRAVL